MTILSGFSWSRLFDEFHCRRCGAEEAYRSRPRGSFEKKLLPLLSMQTVRCERCDQRGYVFRTIPALNRPPVEGGPIDQACIERKESQSQKPDGSNPGSRVA
jgi:hypothetical protein